MLSKNAFISSARPGRVMYPGTSSTSGTRWAGLNGCAIRARSGWTIPFCSSEMSSPEVLLAMTASGEAAASIS